MENLFLTLVNMSITATWAVLAFTVLRPLLKKVPKWVNCFLWGVVGLRLCLPFSFESVFSLIPTTETIPSDITVSKTPQIDTGVGIVNDVVNPVISESFTPDPSYSANPLQVIVGVASYIWLVGVILMVLYSIVSYIILKKKVSASVHYNNNIYYCDNIETPFILGLIKPKIYIPSGVNEEDLQFILEHEQSHLKRKDYLIKPFSFLLLSVYWFNPAIWLWYILLCRDIESACDEKAIKFYDNEYKKAYSKALLNCSTQKRIIMACPVAFGETGVKQRIKSVLNYKKPAFWVVGFAIILTVWLTIFFVTNPKEDNENKEDIPSQNHTYATESTCDFVCIKDNYYYAVIDKTSEYSGLGLYLCDENGEMRFICELGTTFLQGATIGNTFYYIADDYMLHKVVLNEISKPDLFLEELYNGETTYSIENIELVSGKYIYCEAKHRGLREEYPDWDLVYLKINTGTEEFLEIKKNEIPKPNSDFSSLLPEIQEILNATANNIFVQKMNFRFETNGSFESGLITVQFYDKDSNGFARIGNILIAEDFSVFFNEYEEFKEVSPLGKERLTTIDKIFEKVNIIDNSNFCLKNVETTPDSFQLIYFGKALLENGVEREEPYTLYYDSLSYVFSENSKAKYFDLNINKIQNSSRIQKGNKPTSVERKAKYISGKEFFILTPYYETEEPIYKAFEDSSGIAGELLFISFDEMFNTSEAENILTGSTTKNNKVEKSPTTTGNVKLVTSNTPPENTTSPEGYTTPYIDYFTPEGKHVYEYYVTE